MTDQQYHRRALDHLTTEQIRASWVREQEWNRAHGLPHYTKLVEQPGRDPRKARVVAEIAPC